MTSLKGVQAVTRRRRDGSVVVHYYHRASRAKLPHPDDPAFIAALARANATERCAFGAGTLGALVIEYKRSPGFRNLRPETRRSYDRRLAMLEKLNAVPVADIRRRDILALRDALALTAPQAANHLVRVFSVLMQFAVDRDWRETNPCHRLGKIKGGEHKRWPDEAIIYALKHLPEEHRRAIVLALYTGQREGDCLAMKWAQYDGTAVALVQKKTGAALWVPCHKALRAELDAWPRTAETILTTSRGLPWREASFAARFSKVLREHRHLSGLVFHGLRKAAAARLAEAGCSTHEIVSITGHASLAMVEHYTRAADQRRRATMAMAKLELVSESKK